MAKKIQTIGLNELELTNNDLFIRKTVDDLNADARVIVFETHSAILLKDGVLQDTLSAGDYPLFDKKRGLFRDQKIGSFTVELIYVSKTAELQVFWGTPTPFDVRDPVTDIPFRIGASGEFGVRVENPRKFYLKLIGADAHYTVDMLKQRLRGRMLAEIEPALARAVKEQKLSYSELSEHKRELAAGLLPAVRKLFSENYGLEVTYFLVGNIIVNEGAKYRIDAERARLRALKEKGEAKRFCPQCGAPASADDAFCAKCGARLAEEKRVCPACGRENAAGSAFCTCCGKKLS